MDGCTFAALAHGYVNAINTPGALPDLLQSWQAAIRPQLKEFSDKLVREYEREMEESLEGNLPLEERNLMRIHEQTLNRKKEALQQEICHINPLNSNTEDAQPLLNLLEEDHCEELFRDLVKRSKFQIGSLKLFKIHNLLKSFQTIMLDYSTTAVGPAAREVLEKGLSKLNQLRDSLKRIPGSPREVKVIGRGPDRIKLSWEPPEHNPEAVEEYVVSRRIEGGEWEEVKRTKKMKALVTELKSNKKYELRVIATNPLTQGLETQQCSETRMNKSQNAAKAYINEGIPTITEPFHCSYLFKG